MVLFPMVQLLPSRAPFLASRCRRCCPMPSIYFWAHLSRIKGLSKQLQNTLENLVDSFTRPQNSNFDGAHWGKTNFIHYSLRTINFKSVLRYGDGAILFLLMQVMWKIFQSSLPLVIAAGFEEAIVSTCRLIWYDEKAYAYRNLWYAIVFAFVTLPNNSVNALRTKSRYKSILVHYLDFLLSSMCYKILNRFYPRKFCP